jgi:hypothetical protein
VGPWERDGLQNEKIESVRKVITAREKQIDELTFEGFRQKLTPEELVTASQNEDDGVTTTHLNIYTFDITRSGIRDIFVVGWEGFDRFGNRAGAPDVFREFAAEQFPEFADSPALSFSPPTSSTHRVN